MKAFRLGPSFSVDCFSTEIHMLAFWTEPCCLSSERSPLQCANSQVSEPVGKSLLETHVISAGGP